MWRRGKEHHHQHQALERDRNAVYSHAPTAEVEGTGRQASRSVYLDMEHIGRANDGRGEQARAGKHGFGVESHR